MLHARVVLAVVVGTLSALTISPAARAGQYTVDFCKVWETDAPGAVFPGLSGFGAAGEVVDCHSGGPSGGVHQLHVGARMSYDTAAGIRLTVPPDRPAITMDRVWTAHELAPNSGSLAFLRFIGGETLLDNEPAPRLHQTDRTLPGGTRRLEWSVYCSYSAGPTMCQWASAGEVLHVYKAKLFLSESAPPSLSITGGSLLGDGVQKGDRAVTLDAADADSGVSSVAIKLGEKVVNTTHHHCTHADWSPCDRVRPGQIIPVDTTMVPDGTHPVTVVARDAAHNATIRSAGNVTIANRREPEGTVGADAPNGASVANGHDGAPDAGASRDPVAGGATAAQAIPGPAPTPSGASVNAGARNGALASLSARLTVSHAGLQQSKRTRRMEYGGVASLRGRLTDEQARPIGGALLAVLSTQRRAGAPRVPIGTVSTGADGAFSYRLDPGPSRTVTFAYSAFGSHTPTTQASVSTSVRASIAAPSISPRSPRAHQRVRFTGRLRYLPRSGVQVNIQFRDGRRWRTIGLTRTGTQGRFTWFYRFTRSGPGDHFDFRAYVNSPIYPFAAGNSRAVRVRLRA